MATDRDAEGDSEMLSDNSSTENNDDGAGGIQTPTATTAAHPHSRMARPDLSPPASQDAMIMDTDSPPTATGQGESAATAGHPSLSTAASGTRNGNGNGKDKDNSNGDYANAKEYAAAEPGSAWRNKRAQEDYERALESVVDLDFTLDQFGDPFDERDMQET